MSTSVRRLTLTWLATLGLLGGTFTLPTMALAAGVVPRIEGLTSSRLTISSARLSATVNPEGEETSCEFQYVDEETFEATGFAGAAESVSCAEHLAPAEAPVEVSATVTNLRLGTIYHYRILATNTTGGSEEVGELKPPSSPTVSTGPAVSVSRASSNLNGTVNPGGLGAAYYYQYGPTTEYGQSAPAAPGANVAPGSSPVTAPVTVAPLTPGTTYHYRLVASNEVGTSYGQDQTFTTLAYNPPLVSTGPAFGVSANAATIGGTIDPQGAQTTYRFEYGTDTGYGTQAFGTVPPEQGVQTVTLSLTGIEYATTYHYRLIASNPNGSAVGADQTFTSAAGPTPIDGPPNAPLIAVPTIAFPKEVRGATPRTLTNAQKLASALKACAKKPERKRASCQKKARKVIKKKK